MKSKKKTEETYQLTFKGFVTLQMELNEDAANKFLDAMELWLRRCNNNAVILDTKTGGFSTHQVYLENKYETK